MRTCERVQGRGPGNGTGTQKSPGDTAGGTCTGVQNWRLCTSGLRGGDGCVHGTHASLLQPPVLDSSRGSSLTSLGADPECQEMCPTFSLPGRSLLGQPGLCGYQSLWHSSPGEWAGLGVLHKRAGVGGWGGSYTISSRLSRAGELKGPWQLPRSLCLGKETTG